MFRSELCTNQEMLCLFSSELKLLRSEGGELRTEDNEHRTEGDLGSEVASDINQKLQILRALQI